MGHSMDRQSVGGQLYQTLCQESFGLFLMRRTPKILYLTPKLCCFGKIQPSNLILTYHYKSLTKNNLKIRVKHRESRAASEEHATRFSLVPAPKPKDFSLNSVNTYVGFHLVDYFHTLGPQKLVTFLIPTVLSTPKVSRISEDYYDFIILTFLMSLSCLIIFFVQILTKTQKPNYIVQLVHEQYQVGQTKDIHASNFFIFSL